MNPRRDLLNWTLAIGTMVLAGCGGAPEEQGAAEEQAASEVSSTETLFNGKDLTGWTGDPANWSVVDGVIVGQTTEESPLPYNQFLIWEGEVEDFVLSVDLRLTSDGNNSGIQYRSQLRPDLGEYVVSGYQCDMHPFVWANGMVYHEKGRGIICKRGMKAVVTPEGKAKVVEELPLEPEFDPTQWTTYKITATGNRLVHEVNGTKTAELVDHDEEGRSLKGLIAFQIHKGAPMKIEIRNVTLRRLPKSDLISPEETPVPEDAADVNPPKSKPAAEAKGKGPGQPKAKGKDKAAPKAKGEAKATSKAPAAAAE
ncbi:MAG: DUF1080 domain-containing protein [Verrucomicrobiota bacterium]